MLARGWLNRYSVAIISGLIVGSSYVYLASDRLGELNFDRTAAGVAVGTAGTVICLFLLIEVGARNVNLGALQDEKGSLICGLMFTVFLGFIWVAQLFQGLQGHPAEDDPAAWIYREWGNAGDCSTRIDIQRGVDEQNMIFIVDGERHPHRIVGRPTQNSVETDQGIYTLHPDGSMTTTEQGMDNDRLTRCD